MSDDGRSSGGERGGGQGRRERGQQQSTAERAAAAVGVVTATLPDDRVVVTVELVNDQDVGVTSATVEVGCGSRPPEVTFEHVTAGGRATARAVCPPGSSDPNATIRTWQEP